MAETRRARPHISKATLGHSCHSMFGVESSAARNRPGTGLAWLDTTLTRRRQQYVFFFWGGWLRLARRCQKGHRGNGFRSAAIGGFDRIPLAQGFPKCGGMNVVTLHPAGN